MQERQLNAFVADRFEKNMAGKSQALTDALKRYTRHSMQQYRTRYLLARLTQYVDMAFSGKKTAGTLEPFMNLEIEHILLDNPTPSLSANWVAENPKGLSNRFSVISSRACREELLHLFFPAGQVQVLPAG